MTEIVFHLIDDARPTAYWYYAAELCAAAAESGHPTYVLCANHDHVESFDDYLWAYKPDAFVPHTADPEDAGHADVFIGVDDEAGGFTHVINLSGRPINRIAERMRVDEVIDANETNRSAARDRWRGYQQAGAKPQHHAVAQVEMPD